MTVSRETLSRRGLLTGIIAAGASAAIIRTPGLIMPIKPSLVYSIAPPSVIDRLNRFHIEALDENPSVCEVRGGPKALAALFDEMRPLCKFPTEVTKIAMFRGMSVVLDQFLRDDEIGIRSQHVRNYQFPSYHLLDGSWKFPFTAWRSFRVDAPEPEKNT